MVYVTCADEEEAQKIAGAAVQEKLAACANIFAPHRAIYVWEGQIQNEPETAMILKTTAERFDALKTKILELHSYDVPAITASPAEKGHADFLEWVRENAA